MRLLLALMLASAAFYAIPALDLTIARLFHDGVGFPIADNRLVETIRRVLYAGEDIGFLLTLFLALRRRPFLSLPPRAWLFQVLVFAFGPGLVVNGILKPIWGRARPFQITDFGGAAHFTRAWQISDQCCGYRSFVSGEMAGAVALAICIMMILKANRHRLSNALLRMARALACAIPVFTAWQRMAAGKHFLSDIVLAALLTALVAASLRHILRPDAAASPLLTPKPIPPISRLP